jgi:hypothetical protein
MITVQIKKEFIDKIQCRPRRAVLGVEKRSYRAFQKGEPLELEDYIARKLLSRPEFEIVNKEIAVECAPSDKEE